ncbi:MAG: transporter substrate-binding domain-containing protein [Clostridia bacterium]|nr:transporter substrate-binding domain-containing protein [Clostridia bacterium]
MRKRICLSVLAALLVLTVLPVPEAAALDRYLRIGLSADTPPFQFLGEDGRVQGIHIDMMKAIARQDEYELEFLLYENNRACFEALSEGEIDVVLGAIPSTDREEEEFSYTDSLTSSQLCMIARSDVLQRGSKITTAVFASETVRHALIANLNIHQFVAAGDQTKVYERHLQDTDTAMIGIKDSLIYQLAADGKEDEYTVRYNYLGALEFSMVVRSKDAELFRAMNLSINQFKASQEYENICNTWLPISTREAEIQRILNRILVIIGIAVLLVMGYALLMRRMQKMLRRQVAEQTKEIQAAQMELERNFAQLQDESDLRNRIIKYSPNGMLLVDRAYKITYINHSACAIAGVDENCVGRSAMEFPVFREILQKEGEAVFENGTTIETSTIHIGDTPTRMRTFDYVIHQIIQYGDITGVLLTVQDVTKAERRRQEAFERQKSSALTRIAAGIAHEIRNPLMTIRTFASLIGTKGDDKQVQEQFALYVPNEVDRINRLVDNLIHYAKPVKRQVERVCVDEIVADSLSLIRTVLRKSNFRLQQEAVSDLYITVDRDQIKQVMTNIFINGMEAMENKRSRTGCEDVMTLAVRTETQDDKVYIRIRDEGTGMTEEELAQCRDPFFSTKDAGTGLGLALCEQYIHENNGVMEIESVKNAYTEISLIFERS